MSNYCRVCGQDSDQYESSGCNGDSERVFTGTLVVAGQADRQGNIWTAEALQDAIEKWKSYGDTLLLLPSGISIHPTSRVDRGLS